MNLVLNSSRNCSFTTHPDIVLSDNFIRSYRYGFQNQEFDSETGLVNFEYRMHDPRIGRFFAIDPLASKYPHYTPYSFSGNKVIAYRELEGMEEVIVTRFHKNDGSTEIKVYSSLDVGYKNNKDSFWYYAMSKGTKSNWKSGYDDYRTGYSDPNDDKKFNGPVYGVLTVDSYQNNSPSKINYIPKNMGIVDGAEDEKLSTMMSGLLDMGIGAVGIFTAGIEEVFSGGTASTLAYAQFTFSVDKFIGGSNKFFDPKQYMYDNKESAPLKYLVGKMAGKNGEAVYAIFDLVSGTASVYGLYKNGVAPGKGPIEFVGVYDTGSSAKDFITDQLVKQDSGSKTQKKTNGKKK